MKTLISMILMLTGAVAFAQNNDRSQLVADKGAEKSARVDISEEDKTSSFLVKNEELKTSNHRMRLHSPAAKNYQPGDRKWTPIAAVTSNAYERNLSSPQHKNYVPGREADKKEYTKVTTGSKRLQMKGPKAKNYRP